MDHFCAETSIGLIAPSQYVDPHHHLVELDGLYKRAWVFVGLRLELQGISHRGVNIGNTKLLLQCDSEGRPRAFLNVCSHRQAQLCEPGIHSGPVRCPYHGWVYDREGVPVGIPQKQACPQVVAAPHQFRLPEFACDAAGQFIFVRLAKQGPTLASYLGSQFDFLVRASQGLSTIQDEFRLDVPANWKVAIENSLEGYHVPAVHSRTFMQADGMDRADAAPQFYFQDQLHSHLEHAAAPDWISRFARMESKIGRWPWRFEHYTHRLIFPNLTVTSFMGYSFHVQCFEPTAVDCTTVHSRTVGVEFAAATVAGAKMMEHIYADGHAFTRKVFEEDSEICRKVQAGLQCAIRPAVLGSGIEDRVKHFHRAYARALNSAEINSGD